ncbi:DUF1287 domain-containing protein [Saccharicrinis sp. FJH2]|uniref:DUF1287 domain-containing protein n=1 Tax=Saccharicrinis sp. FJH65 TaxID=3344659 RepID=UPI0035F237A1
MRKFFIISVFTGFCLLISAQDSAFYTSLADSTLQLTKDDVLYDPSYFSIPYPNGDVPSDRGVCTDVIIRAYRKVGTDLQKEVHEDMKDNFGLYPKIWGLSRTDKNIDHRRVPNLMVFFSRFGEELPLTDIGSDYKAGDIVCWNLGGNVTHIGIVVNRLNNDKSNLMVVHNIGQGQELADCLFKYKIIGHYRYRKVAD